MPRNADTSDVRPGPYDILPPVPKSRQFKKGPIPKINRQFRRSTGACWRGGLLLLLWMKCRFLRLQIRDQGLNPFNRDLIANRQQHSPVMLDLFVEFGALLAHGGTRSTAYRGNIYWMPVGKDGWTGNLFNQPLSKWPTMVPLRNQTGRFTSVMTAPAMTPIR